MQLTKKQILHIDKTIKLSENRSIVSVDVSDERDGWTFDESRSNIYCVDSHFNIIWQIKEIKTKPPAFDGGDPFYYLAKDSGGEIIADRFSGFTYRIDPETGEATRTGFHK